MESITLAKVEDLARHYSERRDRLYAVLSQLEREISAIKKRYLAEIKQRVASAATSGEALKQTIAAAPELFEKPKTRVFHGIKVGYRKGPGALDWEDDDELVRKIEKMFPDDDEAERYLIVKKKPSAEALEDLDAAQLKRLGVQVRDNADEVVVKPVETDLEKLVKALLKGAQDDMEES